MFFISSFFLPQNPQNWGDFLWDLPDSIYAPFRPPPPPPPPIPPLFMLGRPPRRIKSDSPISPIRVTLLSPVMPERSKSFHLACKEHKHMTSTIFIFAFVPHRSVNWRSILLYHDLKNVSEPWNLQVSKTSRHSRSPKVTVAVSKEKYEWSRGSTPEKGPASLFFSSHLTIHEESTFRGHV